MSFPPYFLSRWYVLSGLLLGVASAGFLFLTKVHHIRSRSAILAVVVMLLPVMIAVPACLRGQQEIGITDVECERFLGYYYQDGSPQLAPKMLQYFLSRNYEIQEDKSAEPAAYLFARIAQLNPGTVRGYEALWSVNKHAGRLYILSILQMAGDDQTRQFLKAQGRANGSKSEWGEIDAALKAGIPIKLNVLDAPIRGGPDLDRLWAEFIVTGNKTPVVRIIDVLDWPDRLRQRLDEWLRSKAAADPAERMRVQENLATALDIRFDSAATQIVTEWDLDIRSMLKRLQVSREHFEAVKKALPFALSDDEVLHIAIKTSAAWSLDANAGQHPLVMEICRDEQKKRGAKTDLFLAVILARPR